MSDSERWSFGDRLLDELGIRNDPLDAVEPRESQRAKLPVNPAALETIAVATLGGGVVLCPAQQVVQTIKPDGQNTVEICGDEWIAAKSTLTLEDWR